jgi:hypothetical protein
MPFRFRVSYMHMGHYRVVRSFDTYAQAEYFIAVNAMVYPLPGLIREYVPSTDRHYLDR